jgi:HK97 family phage portal protein
LNLFKSLFKKNAPQGVTKQLTHGARVAVPKLTSAELQNFYHEVAYLNLMIRKISEGVATTEWSLYRKVGDKKIKLNNHPLLNLIDEFNPLMNTGIDGWYTLQSWLEINGNCYLMMERDNEGLPTYLWVINPNDVLELPSKPNGYNYVLKIRQVPKKVPITEIIHFKNINPFDIYGKGIGTIHAMLDTLQTNKYSNEQVNSYFYNQAVPPYIVGADVTPDQLRELKSNWEMNNKGFWNRHKPYFTNTENISVTKLTDSFNDMQMLQIIENGAETIRQLFGIPPEIIGKVENSNRATIQGAREIYAREVLEYRLKKIAEVLNNTLVREFSGNLILEYKTPVPSDKELMLRTMQQFPQFFKGNEIRELAGLEVDYDKGDEYAGANSGDIVPNSKMPINRADNPKSDEDIRRENE